MNEGTGSDDDVLSPSVGKRMKLEPVNPSTPEESNVPFKNQFQEFLAKEEAELLAQCKSCLAELFFLEKNNFLNYFLWKEGNLSDVELQKSIDDFEKKIRRQDKSSPIQTKVSPAKVSVEIDSDKSQATHVVQEISPRREAASPVPTKLKIQSPHVTTSPRTVASPISPTRRTRHATTDVNESAFITDQIIVPSSSPAPQSSLAVKENQESAAERAKQDAEILRRVAELQKEGLWSAKRLPRCAEPPKPKCHWDNLLEEMVWMSTDFAEEKRWKKAAAKKIAQAVCKHVLETGLNITLGCDEVSTNPNEMSEEEIAMAQCRSVALIVEEFWSQMLRIASWRIESRNAEKEKRERDNHLNFIVGQTEKFSSWLSESLIQPSAKIPSENIEEKAEDSEFSDEDSSESDFLPEEDNKAMDDEETIAKDELNEDGNQEEEVDALKEEAELAVDDLLATLPAEYLKQLGLTTSDQTMTSNEADLTADTVTRNSPQDQISGTEDREKIREEPVVDSTAQISDAESTDFSSRRQRFTKLAAVASTLQSGDGKESNRTPIPFLLRGGSLREYQQVGLDWLVTCHENRINGILADEMGLGKTIQTISLLAHLACTKGIWGPHIIIVPASVLLNWEMEFKRWLPAFKVLTYYGTVKERRDKRRGWTDPDAFHVCITSYQLAVIDQSVLRRRRWHYMILDEAQNIKNFRSRRWQALLGMQSHCRLLLTGTPLQNSLMELWSLMHFLMPQLFESSDDFRDWFANPLTSMVEGGRELNENLVVRLHKVLRPFLLRRLKKDVERQLPCKVEHIVPCRLSRRQRFLYDDFMSRASTKAVLQGGKFVSVLGVLVQLRKVCNHPDLFEPRPVISPFVMPDPLVYYAPFQLAEAQVPAISSQALEWLVGERIQQPSLCGIDFDRRAELCPSQKSFIKEYVNPAAPSSSSNKTLSAIDQRRIRMQAFRSLASDTLIAADVETHGSDLSFKRAGKVSRLSTSSQLRPPKIVYPLAWGNENSNSCSSDGKSQEPKPFNEICTRLEISDTRSIEIPPKDVVDRVCQDESSKAEFLANLNEQRCRLLANRPLYGSDLIRSVAVYNDAPGTSVFGEEQNFCFKEDDLAPILEFFAFSLYPIVAKSPIFYSSISCTNSFARSNQASQVLTSMNEVTPLSKLSKKVEIRKLLQFPELRLIQYDCGKLQALASLLRSLRSDGHRVLIFTQMSRMLDVLEQFLSYHGFAYLRLDGSTRLENRQVLVERFNQDKRIFCFILSTRAGGLGINLTGADTVIFYDSDWNPTTDAQAQDRCHRIGQTRDVHIYRLVSERTVEENVIKRAAQKRLLNELAIEGGDFTTAKLKENAILDIFGAAVYADVMGESKENEQNPRIIEVTNEIDVAETAPQNQIVAFEEALMQAEGQAPGDEADVAAAREARREQVAEMDDNNFFLEQELPLESGATAPLQEQAQTSVEAVIQQPVVEQPKGEVDALEQQLRPVEKLALNIVERFIVSTQEQEENSSEDGGESTEVDAALRSDFEFERLKSIQLNLVSKDGDSSSESNSYSDMEEGESTVGNNDEVMLTYDRQAGQAWIDEWSGDLMPVWLPPTPPSELMHSDTSNWAQQADEFCAGCMCPCDEFDLLANSLSNPPTQLYHAVPMLDSELPPVCLTAPASHNLNRIRSAIIASSPQVNRVTNEDMAAQRVPGGSLVTSLLSDQLNIQQGQTGQSAPTGPKRKGQSRKNKISQVDDFPSAPRSPFERATAGLIRVRDEMQRNRRHIVISALPLPPGSLLGSGSKAEQKAQQNASENPQAPFSISNALSRFNQIGNDWLISEEWSVLLALGNLLNVPTSLTPVQPGHLTNWDAIADYVSSSCIGPHRAAKTCRFHYDSIILPREDARLMPPDTMLGEGGRPTPPPGLPPGKKRAEKRRQQQLLAEQQMLSATMNSHERTAALHSQDGGASATMFHLARFTNVIDAVARFQPHCPHVPSIRAGSSNRSFASHCPLLNDIDWDNAMMPADVAAHRQAAKSRRMQQHFQVPHHHHQQQQQQHQSGAPPSTPQHQSQQYTSRQSQESTPVEQNSSTSGTPQQGRALSDLVKPKTTSVTTPAPAAPPTTPVVSTSSTETSQSQSTVLSHSYNIQPTQNQNPPQTSVPTLVRQASSGGLSTTTMPAPSQQPPRANAGPGQVTVFSTQAPRPTPQAGDANLSSVTRLLRAPSPSVINSGQQQPQPVFTARSAILSPAQQSTSGSSSASNQPTAVTTAVTATVRGTATPTARLQLMQQPGGPNRSGAAGSGSSVSVTGPSSQQVAQLRLQVSASAAKSALKNAAVPGSTSGGSGNGQGELVSVVVTGTSAGGNTFGTGTLRGTPVEALLRRSPTVLSANTIRGSVGTRHIAQLLPQSATGFVAVQQPQQSQQQIVSISNASSNAQPATIVLSAAGPPGGTHAYSQYRSSPQPRPTLGIRYTDASGISSVRLAGGATVSSPLRQAVRPNSGVLTVVTSVPSSTSAPTTATTTAPSAVSASSASSGQQQASPPVHLVATHQLPATAAPTNVSLQPAVTSATPTLSNALTGGRTSLPTLSLGNTTSRLQQQLDSSNVVVSSEDEDGGNGAGDSGDEPMPSAAPARGRPSARRMQRGGPASRGTGRGTTGVGKRR